MKKGPAIAGPFDCRFKRIGLGGLCLPLGDESREALFELIEHFIERYPSGFLSEAPVPLGVEGGQGLADRDLRGAFGAH